MILADCPGECGIDGLNQSCGVLLVLGIGAGVVECSLKRSQTGSSHTPGNIIGLLVQVSGQLEGRCIGQLSGIGQGKSIVEEMSAIHRAECTWLYHQLIGQIIPQIGIVINAIIAHLIGVKLNPIDGSGNSYSDCQTKYITS